MKVERQYNESIKEGYTDIPLIDRINFVNPKHSMPGIYATTKLAAELDKIAEEIGLTKFKVRSTKFGTNVSNADIKDSFYDMKKKGWYIYKDIDDSLSGFNEVYVCSKVVNEDTVKTSDGKWTNKGDEGTHGKFKTKKEADAQRKAMFANGYHEDLDMEEIDAFEECFGENLDEDLDDDNLADYDTIYHDAKLDYSLDKIENNLRKEPLEESEEDRINREADEFINKQYKKAYECYCGQIKTRFGSLDESNIPIDEDALNYTSSKCNYDYSILKDKLTNGIKPW